MRVTFYEVNVDGDEGIEGAVAAATLDEAKEVRAGCQYPYGRVTKIVTPDLPVRQLIKAIFNRVGYAEAYQDVLPAKAERKRESE